MKKLLIALCLISTACFAQNPPYPCGTWQQGGILINCDLYQGIYKMPKKAEDCWKFTNTRPGYNFSFGWFYLECGRPVELPLDDWGPAAVVISGIVGVVYLNRRKHETI